MTSEVDLAGLARRLPSVSNSMKRPRKSLVILTVVLVSAWCAHYLIWGGDIDPPDTSDLLPPQERVPDEENAYFPLDEAFQLLQMTNDEGYSLGEHLAGEKPISAVMLDDLLARNQPVFDRLPAALKRTQFQLQPDPLMSPNPPFRCSLRNALQLLRAKIRRATETSSLDAGVTGCVVRFHLAERMVMQKKDGIILTEGITLGHGETLQEIRRLCQHPLATSEHLKTLACTIDQMGDRSPSIVSAMQYEYLFSAHLMDRIANGTVDIHQEGAFGRGKIIPLPDGTPLFSYIFKPNFTKLAMADNTRMLIRKIGLDYVSLGGMEKEWEAFGRDRFNFEMLWTKNNIVGATFFAENFVFSAPFFYLERECALKCDTAGTRIMLACRLFALKHGRMPEKLEELVPDQIPTVPADPFDGKPMRYDPRRNIVYAVGPDLVDSGGSTNKVQESTQNWTRVCWNQEDVVYPMGSEQ